MVIMKDKYKILRMQILKEVQDYIDNNDIYRVEFGHYEPPLDIKWVPLQTHRINIMEELNGLICNKSNNNKR